MKDLSLHILDIAHNSIRAKATLIQIGIQIDHKKDSLEISIEDDGMIIIFISTQMRC